MKKISTTGRRVLKDDGWHDDNGPIPIHPVDWDPPMTDDEIHAAALSDPDNPPLTAEQLANFRRISPARFIRRKLGMSLEAFSADFGIPVATLRAWERHDAEPSPAELSFLRAIARGPEEVRRLVAEHASA